MRRDGRMWHRRDCSCAPGRGGYLSGGGRPRLDGSDHDEFTGSGSEVVPWLCFVSGSCSLFLLVLAHSMGYIFLFHVSFVHVRISALHRPLTCCAKWLLLEFVSSIRHN